VVWIDSPLVTVSDPVIERSGVLIRAIPLSVNNSGQVVRTPQPVGAMPQFGQGKPGRALSRP